MTQPVGRNRPPTKPSDNKNTSQFVGFIVAGQEYAFRIEQIQEIVILEQVTRLPQVPDYVEGVSNLRGAIIPIINLRKLFGLERQPINSETRTIVLTVKDRIIGCIVDMVTQVIRISLDSIQPAPEAVVGDQMQYISSFAKVDDRLIILLDTEKLLFVESMQSL